MFQPSFTTERSASVTFRQLTEGEDADPTFWFRGRPISAEEAMKRLEAASNSAQSSKTYRKKALLAMRWKTTNDDPGAERDCEEMQELMEKTFGFAVTTFEIPRKRAILTTTNAISNFILNSAEVEEDNEEDETMEDVTEDYPTLLAYYIVSHGSLNAETNKLHLSATQDGQNDVPFDVLFQSMTINTETDVLIILDCCHASAMHRARRAEGRTIELVGACGADALTPTRPASFTRFFVEKARQLQKPTTVEALIQSLTHVTNETPQFSITPRDSSGNTAPVTIGQIPWHARWAGVTPIPLIPQAFHGKSGERQDNAFVTIFLHLEEDPTSQAIENFHDGLMSLTVSRGIGAKALYQLKTSSTLLLIALPSQIWECLSPHPAFLFAGYISSQDLNLSLMSRNHIAPWLKGTSNPTPALLDIEDTASEEMTDDSESEWDIASATSSRTSVSGARLRFSMNRGEILRRNVDDVFKTCYVYGKTWISTYRDAKDYPVDFVESLMTKLLKLKDLYVQNWTAISAKSQRLLVLYLKRLNSLLDDIPHKPQDGTTFVIGDEIFVALRPTEVYQRLGQYSSEIDHLSADDSKYVLAVWEKAQREIDIRVKAAGGGSEAERTMRMVGKWIEQIDLLFSSEFSEIWQKGSATQAKLTEQVKSSGLQHTGATIGMLLTTSPGITPSVEGDGMLDLDVLEFPARALIPTETVGGLPTSSQFLGKTGSRHWAKFSTDSTPVTVIVELKPLSNFQTSFEDGRMKALRELHLLIKALRIGSQDPGRFRVLDCLGLVNVDQNSVGIIFKIPFDEQIPFRCGTLNSLLNQDHSFHLEDRIALATALAWSLACFHDAKWVHKRFTSDNILLFQSTQGSQVSWGTPYLVGFELTRPNLAWSGPIDRASLLWSNRVYTHPDRMENEPSTIRFRKIHDIYSLGVVLLEIGMMTTMTSQRWEQELGALRHSEIRDRFIVMARSLKETMGSVYAEVTRRCLESDFGIKNSKDDGNDSIISEMFKFRVCQQLELIRI